MRPNNSGLSDTNPSNRTQVPYKRMRSILIENKNKKTSTSADLVEKWKLVDLSQNQSFRSSQ